MAQLQRLTALTRLDCLELQQVDWDADMLTTAEWSELARRLPLCVPSLHIQMPTNVLHLSALAQTLETWTGLTSLTDLRLSGCGHAAHAVASGAICSWQDTARQLPASLAHLTNLCRLALDRVPAVGAAGKAADCASDGAIVVVTIAALPRLHTLRLEAMPLGWSLIALSAAQHLTSLYLSNCKLDTRTAVQLINILQCKSCLQHLTLAVPKDVCSAGSLHCCWW
jgi:hypothetical protein